MKDSRFQQSISILLLGMLLGVIAFIILGYAEGLYHNINQIRWLPLIESDNVELADGMVKISDDVEVKALLRTEGSEDNLLYYQKIYEEKIEDEWTVVRTDETILDFSLNGFTVRPEHALKFFDLEEISVSETETTRQTVYGVSAKDKFIVVGELSNNTIEGGEIFAISNKTNETLEKELQVLIHSDWWILRLIAWMLLTFGFIAFVLPILSLLEILPELGPIVVIISIGVSVLVGFLLVTIETLIFAYWYLIFIIVAFIIYLLFKILCCRGKRKSFKIVP